MSSALTSGNADDDIVDHKSVEGAGSSTGLLDLSVVSGVVHSSHARGSEVMRLPSSRDSPPLEMGANHLYQACASSTRVEVCDPLDTKGLARGYKMMP